MHIKDNRGLCLLRQNYNVYADELEISFKCPQCKKVSKHIEKKLPLPDIVVTHFEDSKEKKQVTIKCSHCGYSFKADIIAAALEGKVVVDINSATEMPDEFKVIDYIESPKVHSNNNNDVSIMFDSSSGTTQSVIVTLEELNTAYITTLNQLSKK